MDVKANRISEEEYTRVYYDMLDYAWFADPLFWDELLALPRVAFGCYCRPGTFCHRHLLTAFLCRHANARSMGELTKTNVGHC